ncbi:hypothetical protein Tco_0335128, partial [Tanacetum coccineum]
LIGQLGGTGPKHVVPNTNTGTQGTILPNMQMSTPVAYQATAGLTGFSHAQAQQASFIGQISNGQPGTLNANIGWSGSNVVPEMIVTHVFSTTTPQDPTNGTWNMDTSASSYLNDLVTSLCDVLNMCVYASVLVGDGYTTPVTNSGHSILPTSHRPIHLNNVLITPNIVKNLVFARQFVRDNNCTVEFDAFGFSIKDFMICQVLLRCDSIGDLYPVTNPSPLPHDFLTSQHMSHPQNLMQQNRYRGRDFIIYTTQGTRE